MPRKPKGTDEAPHQTKKSRSSAAEKKPKIPNKHELRAKEILDNFGLLAVWRCETEYKFHPERRWRFDIAYPEIRLAFEVEGGIWTGGRHINPAGFEKDCEKYNAAAIIGWKVIRLHPKIITEQYITELLMNWLH